MSDLSHRINIFVVSELYYPEETSTGYFLTGIAEGLASEPRFTVKVLAAQPTYSRRGLRAPWSEVRNGVAIRRCWSTRFSKDQLPGRLLNGVTMSVTVLAGLLRSLRRGDAVLVVTNPPFLPFIVWLAARLKGARPVLLVHDVYPDVLAATGYLKQSSFLYRLLDWFQTRVLLRFERILVLGRDMRDRLVRKHDHLEPKLRITPNWADVKELDCPRGDRRSLRQELALNGKFLVQFSGNLGRTHGIDDLLAAVRMLGGAGIHFVIYGWGAARRDLEKAVRDEAIENLTLLDPCPREQLSVYLNTCDVFLLPFRAGMAGISVPSRLYNVLAAGNPVIAVCDEESELAQVVSENAIGWVLAPGRPERLAETILRARENRERLAEMGSRARKVAEEQYDMPLVLERYRRVFRELSSAYDSEGVKERIPVRSHEPHLDEQPRTSGARGTAA